MVIGFRRESVIDFDKNPQQARLPALATYLGHASVVSTQYYLTFLQATAEAANERFHTHSAAWLFPGDVQGGRR